MRKNILFGVLSVLLLLAVSSGIIFYINWQLRKTNLSQDNNQRKILVGLSMGSLHEEKWQKYKDEFLKKAAELGVKVDLQVANDSTEKQISQIEIMIIKKVDVLIIIPNDVFVLNEVMAKAQKTGIKVIPYDDENEMSRWWQMIEGAKNNSSVTHI